MPTAGAFNEKDPWHSNANLVFGFCCRDCGAQIDLDWNKEFLEACVEVSERAQAEGWVLAAEWCFLCPNCAPGASKPARIRWKDALWAGVFTVLLMVFLHLLAATYFYWFRPR